MRAALLLLTLLAACDVWVGKDDEDAWMLARGDADGDGYTVDGGDCDNTDPTRHPAAEETWYDGVDQDCAGDDDDDQDGDGFSSANHGGEDCDDLDARVYPAAEEIWYDGVDQDCAGNTSDFDQDGDGFDSAAYEQGSADDCDDTRADVHPGATEVCATEYDDDCDGDVNDPGVPDGTLWFPDADSDGYGDAAAEGNLQCSSTAEAVVTDHSDCDDLSADIHPGQPEICDDAETDEDCNGLADDADDEMDDASKSHWYEDRDGDGFGDADGGTNACENPDPGTYGTDNTDCDDADAAIYPGAEETVGDETDQSCDSAEDCYENADGDAYRTTAVVSSADVECDDPGEATVAIPEGDCDDGSASVYPGAEELIADEIDEDCDGAETCYVDADADAWRLATTTTSDDDDCDDAGEASSAVPSGDCDDEDADVSPGSAEICDALDIDDDCDGLADDDDSAVLSAGKTTWYNDADTDGYGSLADTLAACDLPDGYLATGSDCDDSDADIHPGAIEVCDPADADEDCDGEADDDDSLVSSTGMSTWYRDADRDSYGLATSSVIACDLPSGYVANAEDCNDRSAVINPLGSEVCDSVDADEDCDGLVDDEDDSVASAGMDTWYLDADGDGYGQSSDTTLACDLPEEYSAVATDCDDSDTDTWPGAPEICEDGKVNDCDDTAVDAQAECLAPVFAATDAHGRRFGETAGDQTGTAVAFAGDVNGDGYDEALLGGPAVSAGKGRAFLVEGPWASGAVKLTSANTTARITGTTASDGLGAALSGAGDANGDGYDDLLLGVPGVDRSSTVKENGAAYVVYGPLTGSVSIASVFDGAATGGAAADDAGVSVAGVGDVDASGEDDLLIGADGEDSAGSGAGAAYLLHGPPGTVSLTSATVAAFFPGEAAGDAAGNQVAAGGDADGDGTPDLLIGAPGAGTAAGRAYLIYGPASGTVALGDADTIVLGVSAGDAAGSALGGGGDVDGDGLDDLLVGASGLDDGGAEAGGAYLLYGGGIPSALVLSAADAILSGGAAGDAAGSSVALAADINGDSLDEVFLGAPGAESASADADSGVACLLYGPVASTVDLDSADVEIRGASAGDRAGTAVAAGGDHNADGYGDLMLGAPFQDGSSASDVGYSYLVEGTGY